MASVTEQPLRLAAWLQVLERIEASVRESLPLVVEPAAWTQPASPADALLEALDRRLAHWQACLNNADRHTGEVEALVEARPLEDWVATARAVREKLVKYTAGGI